MRLSHTRAVLSRDEVTMRFPSALNRAEVTSASCLTGSVNGKPVRASHTRAVLSAEAVTTRRPSGLN